MVFFDGGAILNLDLFVSTLHANARGSGMLADRCGENVSAYSGCVVRFQASKEFGSLERW